MSLLPPALRRRLAHRPNLLVVADNIGWAMFDKLIRMVVGLAVGVWVARYLGPASYGQFNFSAALAGLYVALVTMGLNGIVVRELLREPADGGEILGSALAMQVMGALAAIVLMTASAWGLRPGEPSVVQMVALFGVAQLLRASDVVGYWFESRQLSRIIVWVELVGLLVGAAIKIALIQAGAGVLAFAAVVVVENGLIALGLLVAYRARRHEQPLSWRPRRVRVRALLSASWPLIITAFATMIYMRVDQVMLGQMAGEAAVGLYSAALRFSEVWYTIPMMVTAAVFPAILRAKAQSEALYEARMQQLLSALALAALLISVLTAFGADALMRTVFGPAYAAAGPILAIHIWAGVFVFVGNVGFRWYLVEDLQRLYLQRTAVGTAINVALNALLIPRHGAIGASLATLVSQAMSCWLLDALDPRTRVLFRMKTRAMLSPRAWRALLGGVR